MAPLWRYRLQNAIARSSAEEVGQTAARAGRKDLAPAIARKQRQITTAGLVPAGLSRLWYHPVTQVRPPGRSHA
jgi:hypothetical protein